jgi:cobalt-zinc-cadmium efflux system protein
MSLIHNHHHDHPHHHDHAPSEFNRAFIIAIIANALFVIGQMVVASLANSTSLLADAVHNLGDVMGLVLAWIAQRLLTKLPTGRSTYGMKKTSILAALLNGLLLVFTSGMIVTEAIYRFIHPSSVDVLWVILMASIGIVVNGATATLFMRQQHDLNIQAAFLHLMYDALISAGVVVAAILMYLTGWLWIDPFIGILIAMIILKGTWSLFTDSFRMMIDGVPSGIDILTVHGFLSRQPGVKGVHDLHIWALSTQENALSVHLWMPDQRLMDEARVLLIKQLRDTYRIHHVTIQVEQTQGVCEDFCIPFLSDHD